MPAKMPHRVRRTYTRRRAYFSNQAPVIKLVVYIRSDQAVWLAEEEERRLARKVRRRSKGASAPVPPPVAMPDPVTPATPPVIPRKGRGGKLSEIVREGIDLAIEYARHAEFMAAKLRPPATKPPAPVPEPADEPIPVRVAVPAPVKPKPATAPRRWLEGHATRGMQPAPGSTKTGGGGGD